MARIYFTMRSIASLAVSYTHLDFLFHQIQGKSQNEYPHWLQILLLLFLRHWRSPAVPNFRPLLDVYKRQVYPLARSFKSPARTVSSPFKKSTVFFGFNKNKRFICSLHSIFPDSFPWILQEPLPHPLHTLHECRGCVPVLR